MFKGVAAEPFKKRGWCAAAKREKEKSFADPALEIRHLVMRTSGGDLHHVSDFGAPPCPIVASNVAGMLKEQTFSPPDETGDQQAMRIHVELRLEENVPNAQGVHRFCDVARQPPRPSI